MKKKILIIILSVLLVAGAGAAGIAGYRRHRNRTTYVNVFNISECGFVGNYYENSDTMDGSVKKTDAQTVTADSSRTVSALNVEVGQKVKPGDVLLTYDEKEEQLKLDSMQADLGAAETKLKLSQNTLKKLQNTTPVPDTPAVTPQPAEGTETDAGTQDPGTENTGAENNGSGTTEETYTKAELDKAIRDTQDSIRDQSLSIQKQKLDIRKQQKEMETGSVKAEVSGVVTKADISDATVQAGKPSVIIGTNGEMSVVFYVSEYQVNRYTAGKTVSVYSYDTGNTYTGTVSGISDTPDPDHANASGYTASYYAVTAVLDDSRDLPEDGYVQVTEDQADTEDLSNQIVLPDFFLKKDAAGTWCLVDADGKLKKKYLKTGKNYGTDTAILSGLSPDDSVAFVYGKDAKEGVRTRKAKAEDLYN